MRPAVSPPLMGKAVSKEMMFDRDSTELSAPSHSIGARSGKARVCAKVRTAPVPLVQRPVSYVDSICLWLPRLMAKSSFRPLRLALFESQGGRKRRLVLRRQKRRDGSWFFRLYIHQPTPAALEVLAATLTPFRIVEVHVALDLASSTFADAAETQAYVVQRLLKSARPSQPLTYLKGTVYYGRGTRRGVEVAIYSDRVSKALPETPCAHVEWRLMGAKALRDADLDSPIKIFNMRHGDFWTSRLQLWRPIDAADLLRIRQRQLRKYPEPRWTEERTPSLVRTVARWATGPDGRISVHDLIWVLGQIDFYRQPPKRLLRQEAHDWMIPGQENSLWYSSPIV